MKNIAIRFGFFAFLIQLVLFTSTFIFMPEGDNMEVQEWLGYISIILSMSMIYFGVRNYRDQLGEEGLSFGKALLTGVLIAVIPSVLFGIGDVIYALYINPDFMEEYYSLSLSKMEASMSAAEFEIAKAKMEAEKEMFSNPWMQFFIMSMTVFVIGFIVALISSLFLQRKKTAVPGTIDGSL